MLIFVFMSILFLSTFALAGDDASTIDTDVLRYKNAIRKILSGEKVENPAHEEGACNYSQSFYPKREFKKAKYNDLFFEIKTDEQIKDIKNLIVELKKLEKKDCYKAISIWNTYDEKWYEPARQEKLKNKNFVKKELLSLLEDRGEDKLDAVMINNHAEGVILSVPRNYIWSDRFQKDGLNKNGIGIAFRYPSMGRGNGGESKYGDKSSIRGILKPINYRETLPCYGFEGKDICTFTMVEGHFTGLFTLMNNGTAHPDGIPYKCLWRKTCGYRDGYGPPYRVEPVFDEDVQMWRLGTRGYYLGSPEFPSYWVDCEKFSKDIPLKNINRGVCEASVKIGDGLYFDYSFSRRMFWEHREIQKSIKDKIESFIVKRN